MTIGQRIKDRRIQLGLTVDELASILKKNRATVYRYESNEIEKLPISILEPLSKALHTTPAYLMGWDENEATKPEPKRSGTTINVLGRVAAGIPIDAIEDIIDTEEITEEMAKTGYFFGLQIHGDSMEPKISDGDVVIVRRQDDAESDQIVIALVNGDEDTCKRLKKYATGIALLSTNPKYEPMYFSNEEIVHKPVKIIGKVVELRAKF